MAQAKKKPATKTAKKTSAKSTSKKRFCYQKYERGQACNVVFVISMSVLATALLIADILMMY